MILELIRSLNLFKDNDPILTDGRLCVPRALFIFENHYHKGNETAAGADRDDDPKLLSMVHNLEDVIFNALRASYIISNQTCVRSMEKMFFDSIRKLLLETQLCSPSLRNNRLFLFIVVTKNPHH